MNLLHALASRLDRRGRRLSRVRPTELPPPPPIRLVGHLTAATGVGEVARSALNALRSAGADVTWRDIEPFPTLGDVDALPPAADPNDPRVNLVHTNAGDTRRLYDRLGRSFFRRRTNIGFWSWEMPRFPGRWQGAFELYDEIWVGSRYTQAALASVAPIPVVRMPTIVDPAAPAPASRARFGIEENRTVFLFMCDACSILERKNPLAVVRAFELAFGRSARGRPGDPLLVLKLNNLELARRRPALFAHSEETLTRLLDALEQVGGLLLTERYDRATTSALMNSCDAYVSLHRCEGFGLTMAEAMHFGKPCIATGYSGNLDFMTPSNSYLVGYTPIALERDWGPYEAGDVWADPDVEHAAALMQQVVARPDEAQRRARRAADDIRAGWGPRAGADAMLHRLALRREWLHSTT